MDDSIPESGSGADTKPTTVADESVSEPVADVKADVETSDNVTVANGTADKEAASPGEESTSPLQETTGVAPAPGESAVAPVFDGNAPEESDGLCANPFRADMDRTQRILRIFCIIGLFPLFWIGWLIGLIYGVFKKKTKRIHFKLVWLLVALTLSAGAALLVLLFYLIGTYVDDIGLVKSEKCLDLKINIKTYPTNRHDPVMLFVFDKADGSYNESPLYGVVNTHKCSVVAANMPSTAGSLDKATLAADPTYGLTKFAAIVGCLNIPPERKVTLVTMFNRGEAAAFKPNPGSIRFASILAINSEVVSGNTAASAFPYSQIASHVGFVNKEITCGTTKVMPAVVITVKGKRKYQMMHNTYEALNTAFYASGPNRPATTPVRIDTRDGFESVMKSLEEPLLDLIAYEKGIGSEGLAHDVTCRKALH